MPDQELEELKAMTERARTICPSGSDLRSDPRYDPFKAAKMTLDILARLIGRLEREERG